MKILFLTQRVPYPPNRGANITCFRLIERMRREHEVAVATFAHDEKDVAAARELEGLGYEVVAVRHHPLWARIRSLPLLATSRPLTLGVLGSRELQREVDRLAGTADLSYAYSSSMGAFLVPQEHIPRVMHFAELDSDKWRQYSKRVRFPASWVYRREWRTLFAFEEEVAHTFDENVFCTPLEEQIFRERIPGAPSLVMTNGVDLVGLRPSTETPVPGRLAFVGVMDYYPNVEGCVWFAEEILPPLRERVPEAHLQIIGSHPTREVRRLGERPGIEVTGFVDDPGEYLARASISVAPLRIARGIQNKVLEAMAMGLPIVGTTNATQGVGGVSGRDYVVADDVAGQVEAICGLLRDSAEARALGERARAYVEEHHDWERCLAPLDALIRRLTEER